MLTIIIDWILRKIRWFVNFFTTLIGIFYPSNRGFLPPIDNDLLLKPAIRLAEMIKTGELKSEDLIRAYIERCKLINKDLNAIVHDNFEGALQEARLIDKRIEKELRGEKSLDDDNKMINDYPFLGVPYTAKNSISIKGFKISCGTYYRKGMIAENDCQSIVNMKKSGAIFLALTNVPDTTLYCDSFNYIDGQTNNPFDKSCIPGGSSGGEGALISSAGSIFGIGSDIAGSLRIPANFCGIYSHCTTAGKIIIDELFPKPSDIYPKVLTIGPMCRYACDLRPMLKVITNDKLDLSETTKFNYKDLNVYHVRDLGDPLAMPVETDILNGMDKMLNYFKDNGSNIMELNMKANDPDSFYDFRWATLFWLASIYDPNKPHFIDLISNGKKLNPFIELIRCMFGLQKCYAAGSLVFCIVQKYGEKLLTKKIFDKYNQTKTKLHQLLKDNVVILSPISVETAPKHNQSLLKLPDCIYTTLWSSMDVAITTVPMGINRDGMPFAIQIIAAPNNDKLSLSIAEELEKNNISGWTAPCKISINK